MVPINKINSLAILENSPPGFFAAIKAKFILSDDQKERIAAHLSFIGDLGNEVFTLGSHIYSSVQAGMPYPAPFLNAVKAVEEIVAQFFEKHPSLYTALQGSQVLSIAEIPGVLYNTGTGIRDFFKGGLSQKIESALDVFHELGKGGYCVSEVAYGLRAIGAATEKSIAWAAPLSFASTGLLIAKPLKTGYKWWQKRNASDTSSLKLSFASQGLEFLSYAFYLAPSLMPLGDALWTASEIVEEGGKWKENREFLKELKYFTDTSKKGLEKLKNLEKALALIGSKDEEFLKERFAMSGKKLKQTAEKVSKVAIAKLKSGNSQKIKEGEKELAEFVQSMQERIEKGQFCRSLSFVSGGVNMLGAGVIMVPQLAPVGYSLMMAGSGLTLGKLIYEKSLETRFEKFVSSKIENQNPKSNHYQSVIEEIKTLQGCPC